MSVDWLPRGDALTVDELDTLDINTDLNRQITGDRVDETAEYDPARDVDFRVGAYAFAFWRLCSQTTTDTRHHDDQPFTRPAPASGPTTGPVEPVDRVRVVHLRAHPATGGDTPADAQARRYHHRFPVRMHKVRQYYPSLGVHKVIWRGPYIKGPDGAPLLVGGKAHAVR
jgi:hypothetical protein